MKGPVEPAADKDADQHRHDDDPAEDADLGQAPADRGIAFLQPSPVSSSRKRTPFTKGSCSLGSFSGAVMRSLPILTCDRGEGGV